ncbi:MAG: hypothetical protein ACXWEK_06095 [Solirubrobacterales bacterium]
MTIGSDLSPAPNSTIGGSPTLLQTALPGARLTSPVNGLVVRWRAMVAGATTNAGVRVVRPLGGSRLFLSEASLVGVPEGGAAIPAVIPISVGDSVALDLDGTLRFQTPVAGAVYDSWAPHPGTGIAPATPTPPTADRELYYNAEIEPTNTFTLSAPVLDRKKGSATVNVELPNVGSVQAISTDVKLVAAARPKPKKKKKAKRKPLIAPFTATSVGPGTVTLKLDPSKPIHKTLRATGKAKGQVSITYTPQFGTETTQNLSLKLKLNSGSKKKR